MSNKRIERLKNFWNSDEPNRYNKFQLIAFAKDDIEILLNERDELEKILNLLNAIEVNFNNDGKEVN